MKESFRLSVFLMIVAAVSAAALSGTYILTAPKIEAEKIKETRLALKEVLPKADSFEEAQKVIDNSLVTYYTAKLGNKPVGKGIKVSPTGYAGPIEMLVGINNSGVVTGVKVLSLIETPGLGLNATDPEFLSQFKGKTSIDKLKAKYDVDALTGATITSQAVADGVKEALILFKKL